MNYPVLRNLCFLALAWHSLAIRFRSCRHSDRLIACRSGYAGISGAKMTCNNRLTSGSVMPVAVFFPQAAPLHLQEPQCQHHQGHVMVPAAPAADLIVVQTHLLFASQKAVLGWPAIMTRLRQCQQRTVRSGSAHVVFDV